MLQADYYDVKIEGFSQHSHRPPYSAPFHFIHIAEEQEKTSISLQDYID